MTLVERIIRAILYGRFEPIETVLALLMLIGGMVLLLYGSTEPVASTAFAFDRKPVIYTAGGVFATLGITHLISMIKSHNGFENVWHTVRKTTILLIAMSLLYTTAEVILQVGLTHPRWLAYGSLSAIAGITYLALVIPRD